ncbi:hypothetical protein P280DRAFT_472521 [Massarina eburnea CBS 473.64]|uniref:Hydrophobin n=1 Tax=Massarina eburnea CBS 473.64 TaxID=1395130 RepID=A0A6A6RSJ9_9PLEO|nr:hypothetical protein P280DRAFT_472521 [Massarina eburnea CBS 473.64]
MRKAFVLLPALGLAAPDFVTDFQPAILEQSPAQNNNTISEQGRELFKRSNCASGYAVCNSINRPDLCCQTNQVCSADSAGNAACCPINAACTGTLGVIVGITSSISVSATTVSSQTTNFATPTTTGSFVQATNGAQSTQRAPRLIQNVSRMLRAVRLL